MKAERVSKLLDDIVWDEVILAKVPKGIFEQLIRYILRADIDNDAFDLRIASIQKAQIREQTMSLAEQIRQKGQQEGRQEGIVIARQNAVLDALAVRFSEVPVGLREMVEVIRDEARLRVLLKLAIQVSSLEEFAHSLG